MTIPTFDHAERTIVFHQSRTMPKATPGLLTLAPERLRPIYREFDDLAETVSLCGIDARVIGELGYKVCRPGLNKYGLEIPRGAIVIPCLSPSGQIVALHDEHGNWFTSPKPHVRSLIRAQFTNTIEIFTSTIEADAAAISRNVAVVALNGFPFFQLSQRLVGEAPTLIGEMGVAA